MSTHIASNGIKFTVDDADDHFVYGRSWHAHPSTTAGEWYIRDSYGNSLHRALLAPPADLEVDHIDTHPINNCRSNLRLATVAQNRRNTNKRRDNTSGVKGVAWCKQTSMWEVRVKVDGKQKFGGRFKLLEDAAKAASELRARLHGEFARD